QPERVVLEQRDDALIIENRCHLTNMLAVICALVAPDSDPLILWDSSDEIDSHRAQQLLRADDPRAVVAQHAGDAITALRPGLFRRVVDEHIKRHDPQGTLPLGIWARLRGAMA